MAETAKAAVAVVGIDIGKNSFHVVGLDRTGKNEVSKYLSLTHHVYTATPLLVSARLYKKLGAEDQKTLKEAARAACEEQRKFNARMEDKDIATLKEKGMEVNKVSGLTAFRDKMRPVYDEYRPKIGPELMDQWLAALAK